LRWRVPLRVFMAFALSAGIFAASGCFRPSITDGGLICGLGSSCPEGFSCSIDLRCHRAGSDGGRAETRLDGASEKPAGDASDAAEAGSNLQTRVLGESCNQIDAATANRTDTCVAGLICIDGNMGALCFKKCATDGECGDATCERRQIETSVPTKATVCGLSPTPCNPLTQTGCSLQRICYLRGSVTICETASGELGSQIACTYSRDCLSGLTCAADNYCRRVCSVATPCNGGETCQRAVGATYGYCNL
jgi:hypothetical protein